MTKTTARRYPGPILATVLSVLVGSLIHLFDPAGYPTVMIFQIAVIVAVTATAVTIAVACLLPRR